MVIITRRRIGGGAKESMTMSHCQIKKTLGR
ncbi:hypothetical protein Gotur_025292 [Gossypium turneri]